MGARVTGMAGNGGSTRGQLGWTQPLKSKAHCVLWRWRGDYPLDPGAAELLPTGDDEEDAGAALEDVPPPEDELVDIISPITPTVQVPVRDGS